MTPQELTILIDAYSEVYSNALTEEVAEVGQSPTPGGVKKAPPSALPQRKKGQPITTIKDSYEIVLDYLMGEGFAHDKHSAEQIMLGMSEAWVGQIVEQQNDATSSMADKNKDNRHTPMSLKGSSLSVTKSGTQDAILRLMKHFSSLKEV